LETSVICEEMEFVVIFLTTPIPSIATHMQETCLAPAIDWEKFFEERFN